MPGQVHITVATRQGTKQNKKGEDGDKAFTRLCRVVVSAIPGDEGSSLGRVPGCQCPGFCVCSFQCLRKDVVEICEMI